MSGISYSQMFLFDALSAKIASSPMYSFVYRASLVLHDEVFYQLVRAPMSFFDTTPLGKQVCRSYSKHMRRREFAYVGEYETFETYIVL
jgi:hypothetical protein